MKPRKIYRFDIDPQTAIRTTQNDRWFFRIPRESLKPDGLKRLKRIERYNNYKITLSALAKSQKFIPPNQGGHLIFYFPVPKSWRKHKKEQMHMKLHTNRPDWDNAAKAFFDSLMSEDKEIADVRVTKRWVNSENGWIEFHVYDPGFRNNDNLI